jgi:hypothetical protein
VFARVDCVPFAAATVRVVTNAGVAITVGAGRARAGTVTAARVLCLMLVAYFQEGYRMPAAAAVRIDVEFTLTCATPMVRARMLIFKEIAVGANAAAVVKRRGVVHTVIGARLVVVSVHVGHGGW